MVSPEKRYALFTDIDRTLIGSDFNIPVRNTEAIKKARELGHKVFINTGRSFGNIPEAILEQVQFDGIISGNGTMATLGSQTLFAHFMPGELIEKIAGYVFSRDDVWAAFEGVKGCYVHTNGLRDTAPFQIPVRSEEELRELSADDSFQVIALSRSVPYEFLESLKDEITYFSFGHYYDIVVSGNNKAYAMKEVAGLLGIPMERTMAFGDSENDLEMVLASGTGVAVSNAQQILLDSADYISDSCSDGGVGKAIEEILLKGEI